MSEGNRFLEEGGTLPDIAVVPPRPDSECPSLPPEDTEPNQSSQEGSLRARRKSDRVERTDAKPSDRPRAKESERAKEEPTASQDTASAFDKEPDSGQLPLPLTQVKNVAREPKELRNDDEQRVSVAPIVMIGEDTASVAKNSLDARTEPGGISAPSDIEEYELDELLQEESHSKSKLPSPPAVPSDALMRTRAADVSTFPRESKIPSPREAKGELRAELKSEPSAEARAQAKTELKTEAKPETKRETKPETKRETKEESKRDETRAVSETVSGRPSAPPPPHELRAPIPTSDPPGQPREPTVKPWFEEFFSDDYLRTVRMPRYAHVSRQCDFIENTLGLSHGAAILDAGCGLGFHAVELAARGYEVVGIDLSLAMLSRASDEAQAREQHVNFIHADLRELAFESTFDAIVCIGTTFGYFDDDTNREVLARIHRALKPKGLLYIEVVNRDYVMRVQPNLVWFEGDGCICMEETHFNFRTSRLHIKRTMMSEDGKQKDHEYSIRLYSLHELGQILHREGFRVAEVTGHEAMPGVFFGSDSERMIVVAEKRSGPLKKEITGSWKRPSTRTTPKETPTDAQELANRTTVAPTDSDGPSEERARATSKSSAKPGEPST